MRAGQNRRRTAEQAAPALLARPAKQAGDGKTAHKMQRAKCQTQYSSASVSPPPHPLPAYRAAAAAPSQAPRRSDQTGSRPGRSSWVLVAARRVAPEDVHLCVRGCMRGCVFECVCVWVGGPLAPQRLSTLCTDTGLRGGAAVECSRSRGAGSCRLVPLQLLWSSNARPSPCLRHGVRCGPTQSPCGHSPGTQTGPRRRLVCSQGGCAVMI